ncbi:hypothetical protein CTI12_AA402960 [Artemisia annua]|uniref:RNA-directed DNA polymerase, eukaryota, Reverse transcriptase zinc-binding domain protein n=1 Tax=Artemisia annua TaxID=35608 RepID=A0A2U1MA57_ARTAN|nr:hypothetical protein CTI12_AA402960 [Artemisia annua]
MEVSDHCPIMLLVDATYFGHKSFKLFDDWMENDGFSKVFESSWSDEVNGGTTNIILKKKLKKLKEDIKHLCRVQSIEIDRIKNDIQSRLLEWDAKAESSLLSRLKINLAQSRLFGIGIPPEDVANVLEDASSGVLKKMRRKWYGSVGKKFFLKRKKKDGGLGVASIKAKNTGLLGKWKWMINRVIQKWMFVSNEVLSPYMWNSWVARKVNICSCRLALKGLPTRVNLVLLGVSRLRSAFTHGKASLQKYSSSPRVVAQ